MVIHFVTDFFILTSCVLRFWFLFLPDLVTSVAFDSAAFVQKRYGWEFGIPAYLLAGYVGYTRIEANKHDFVDVLAGAAIGVGMSYLFTKRYDQKKKLAISSGFIENIPTIGLSYKF